MATAVAAALALHGAGALGADWTGATGGWSTAGNWDTSTVPDAATAVVINNGGTAQIGAGVAAASADLSLGSGSILIAPGGSLGSSGTFRIGDFGTGALTVDGAGAIWNHATFLDIGRAGGSGTLAIRNGGTAISNVVADVNVGFLAGGNGTVLVDGAGSTWTVSGIVYMGRADGSGTLTVANGGVVTASTLRGEATIGANTINIGAGGGAGVLNVASVNGASGSNTVVNFNHTGASYFFTRDGTAGGTAVALTGSMSVNHVGTGTTVLTGNHTYTGATSVNAGTLAVNGSIVSPVTVNAGGALGGSGTIGNTVTIAGSGVLAPGSSIGTIAVSSVSFMPGSIYRAEVNAAGAGDRINATGTATLAGGTVNVRAEAGTYRRNTTYTILNAAGGVTGAFSDVTSNLAFLAPSLAYDANNVFLTLTTNGVALSSVAGTKNQTGISTYLEAVANEPGLSGLMTQLEGLSAEQARSAFSSLSGDTLSAPATAALQGTGRFLGLLAGRVGAAGSGTGLAFSGLKLAQASSTATDAPFDSRKGKTRGFWTQADAARGEMKGDGNATGFDWRGGGVSFGFDAELQRGTVIGGAVSYGQSNVALDSNAGSAKVKSPRIALYGGHTMGPWEFKGAAGYADQDFDTRRNVTIASSTTIASATHRGDEYSAYAEAQYTIPMGGYKIKPLAGLRYINLKEEGYTESGSAANLTVETRKIESLVSLLGARYVKGFNSGRGEFEARAVWGHEFGDVDPAVSGRLAAAPATASSFTVAGVPIERDFLILGAGFANELRKNLFLHADASVELRAHGQNQQALTAALRYAW